MGKKLKVMLLLPLLFVVSGCSNNNFEIKNLMRPPKPEGEEALIIREVERFVGNDIILKCPNEGDNRSSVIIRDLNEGSKEAIIFYSIKNNSGINIMILRKLGGKWFSIDVFEGRGTSVDKVYFSDMDSNGSKEIVVGWGTYNDTGNKISVYNYVNERYKEIKIKDSYSEFIISDLDGDGINEMLLLSLEDHAVPAKAQLIKVNTKTIGVDVLSVIEMSPHIMKYRSVTCGKVEENKNAVFVGAVGVENSMLFMGTLYWDSALNSLGCVYLPSDIDVPDKDEDVFLNPRDIDDDGIVEVPYFIKDNKVKDSDQERREGIIVDWKKYDVDQQLWMNVCRTTAKYNDFVFSIPDKWFDCVELSVSDSGDTLYFTELIGNGINAKFGADVLKIQTMQEPEYKKIGEGQCVLLSQVGNKCYVAELPEPNNHLAINEDEIKDRFIVFDN